MKKKLRIILPITLGIFFIYLTFKITSEEERSLILSYIKSAKIEFVLLAMSLGALADVIRGLRWQFLAKAIGYKSNAIISIASVYMCYTSNMLIARSGEIIRATVLSDYNKVPIGKTFGTIAAERLIDISVSLFILILVWAFQYEVILESFFDDNILYFVDRNLLSIIGVLFLMLITLFVIISRTKKIKNFFNGILEGFLSLTRLKNKLFYFIIYSSLIWICYILA